MTETTNDTDIILRLERAARTLKALPHDQQNRHKKLEFVWSNIAPGSGKADNRKEKTYPDARHIDELYLLLDLLLSRSDLERKLIWARANRLPWAALQQKTGRSRTHLYKIYKRGLAVLAEEYNRSKSS